MKKTFSILSVSIVLFILTSCLKNKNASPPCTTNTVQSEQAQMSAFAAANGITYTVDPSGMYYQITNPGSGANPSPTSKIFVTYTGKLVSNGTIFDSQNNATLTGWILNTLI